MNNLSTVAAAKVSHVIAQTKTKQAATQAALASLAPAAAVQVKRGLWLAVRLQKNAPIPYAHYCIQ